jgi:hypothetical protein
MAMKPSRMAACRASYWHRADASGFVITALADVGGEALDRCDHLVNCRPVTRWRDRVSVFAARFEIEFLSYQNFAEGLRGRITER